MQKKLIFGISDLDYVGIAYFYVEKRRGGCKGVPNFIPFSCLIGW